MIERALLDYYRCPEPFVRMAAAGELAHDSGYFRFGPSICYGQSTYGRRSPTPDGDLDDTERNVVSQDGILQMPFDPSQVTDNLRFERYALGSGAPHDRLMTWHHIYYASRRFLPVGLRRLLQRTYFRDWKKFPFPHWPVDDTVDQILARLLLLSARGQGLTRVPFVWFWPDGALSCAIVTHDVETAVGRD